MGQDRAHNREPPDRSDAFNPSIRLQLLIAVNLPLIFLVAGFFAYDVQQAVPEPAATSGNESQETTEAWDLSRFQA